MAEDWDFYPCRVNDAVSSIMVDLGLRETAPQPERPWLLWVWVYMLNPREDGLSSAEEAPRLWEIGDRLDAVLASRMGALTAGRITGAGRREFYFYGPRAAGFDEVVQEALSGFEEYDSDHGMQEDPDWSQYLELLYPRARDLQRIWDRRVVEKLKEQGDLPHIPREVDHFLYFPSEQSREQFVTTVEREGYSVRERMSPDPSDDGPGPFGLHLCRQHAVELETVDALVVDLVDRAEAVGGHYDGWGTTVVKEVPQNSGGKLPWTK